MTTRDPVCGMTVEPAAAAASRVHAGKTYFFCAPGCATAFEKEPERYLKSSRRPGRRQLPMFENPKSEIRNPKSPSPHASRLTPHEPEGSGRVSLAVEGMHCASC